MIRFMIEREIPGAGELTQEELVEIANTSTQVVDTSRSLLPPIPGARVSSPTSVASLAGSSRTTRAPSGDGD